MHESDGQHYEERALSDLRRWQARMTAAPGSWNRLTRGVQQRINAAIPERVHAAITAAIRQMTQAMLTGSQYVGPAPQAAGALAERELQVRAKIERYRRTAALEGGITGAGGIFMGLADFPLLFGIKLKLLFDIGALYGHPGADYRERLYMLHIFQLTFSSDEHRLAIYRHLADWEVERTQLPATLDEVDWRAFQQEYRDYIDLAKLVQLVPVIGAPVGAVVNSRLVAKLGENAINAYRMRWFAGRAR